MHLELKPQVWARQILESILENHKGEQTFRESTPTLNITLSHVSWD